MKEKYKKTAILLVIFALGALTGFIFAGNKPAIVKSSPVFFSNEVRSGGYKFIDPLLECEYNQGGIDTGLDRLRDKIQKFVDDLKDKGTVTEASVYFRDLRNGPWFGVDQHASFSPASLLKLPVMMAYLKLAESDPALLSKEIKFDGEVGTILPQNFSISNLEAGKSYKVQDLIERMIQQSDNAALVVLEKNIDNELINKITLDLGVETANSSTPEDFMSVKGYASLFRILFNASYLSKNLSEKALEILSKTDFRNGLVAGVPSGVAVSHKYGERGLANNVNQLHDCGIVYYPNRPYLLCIMTRGNNLYSLASAIREISSEIYKDLDDRYKNKE